MFIISRCVHACAQFISLAGPPALSAPSTGQQQASQGTADHASLARKVTTSIRKKTSGLSKGQLATPFNVHDETLDIDLGTRMSFGS